MEAHEPKPPADHAAIGKQGDGLCGTAQGGSGVVLVGRRQGIGHGLQDLLRVERIVSHDGGCSGKAEVDGWWMISDGDCSVDGLGQRLVRCGEAEVGG